MDLIKLLRSVNFRTKFDRNIPVFEDENLPPTYESIFGQIREEWLTAENFTEFLKNAGELLPLKAHSSVAPMSYENPVNFGIVRPQKCFRNTESIL